MKSYGAMKATEFTRKQIGVIFGMAKRNELKVEKFIISNLYDLADFYGYDDNGSVAANERKIKDILDNVFAGNMEKAQMLINEYTEFHFNHLGRNAQKNADRELVK